MRIYCSYGEDDPTFWRIEKEYARATTIGVVAVMPGFLFDGASVPQRFQDLIPCWGLYSGAALIHDGLYTAHPCPRETADRIFLDLMLADGVPHEQAWLMWKAVCRFGQPAWDSPADEAQVALVNVTSFTEPVDA